MLYNTPDGFEIKRKTIQYLEQTLAHIVAKHGCLVVMIPSLEDSAVLNKEDLNPYNYADALDGLVLQGGIDISPGVYGEEPLPVNKNCATDPIRDRYELKLLKAFTTRKKPVLGICRGFQLMNIFNGGTLYQDLPTQRAGEVYHNKPELYDEWLHNVAIHPEGVLSPLYPPAGQIVSIHHQGVKVLGKDLRIEAISDDGLIEAFSGTKDNFYVGVQWHPEFHKEDSKYLASEPLIKLFLKACTDYKAQNN
ncbi:Gamma-glutamyl-gamma-aminobutyrate hydrolase PuuD [compost metagenome]